MERPLGPRLYASSRPYNPSIEVDDSLISPLTVVLALFFVYSASAQTPLDDRFFTSDGVRIRYVDVGRGEPVVLVHGFSSSLDANWGNLGIIEKLSKDFRVIALDCRGHGKSDKPHDAASYGINMIEDVTRLLDHLAVRRAHIVGYSMGGAIAGKFITTHPDRVISAVFGGSAPRLIWTAQSERDSEELAVSLESGQGMRPLILRPAERAEAVGRGDCGASRATLDARRVGAGRVQRGNKNQVVTAAEVVPCGCRCSRWSQRDPVKAGVDAFKQLKPELTVIVIDGATHSGGGRADDGIRPAVHDFLAAHRSASDF